MTPNDDRRPSLGWLLLQGARWFDDALIGALHAAGWPAITHSHSMLFPQLDPGGTTQSELARRLGVSRQAVHQLVSDLVSMGLIEVVHDPSSRRSKLVRLTRAGRTSVGTALAAFEVIEERLSARIGTRHVAALRGALEADWGTPPEI